MGIQKIDTPLHFISQQKVKHCVICRERFQMSHGQLTSFAMLELQVTNAKPRRPGYEASMWAWCTQQEPDLFRMRMWKQSSILSFVVLPWTVSVRTGIIIVSIHSDHCTGNIHSDHYTDNFHSDHCTDNIHSDHWTGNIHSNHYTSHFIVITVLATYAFTITFAYLLFCRLWKESKREKREVTFHLHYYWCRCFLCIMCLYNVLQIKFPYATCFKAIPSSFDHAWQVTVSR